MFQRGADPNILGHDGDTPLYWAAKIGDRDMVRLLLDGRANPNQQGCNSIDNFLGPESGPEPCPSHFWSFETYLNL